MGCGAIFLIPVYIVKGIYNFFRWGFTNGVKGYVIMGIAIIGLLIGGLVIKSTINSAMKPEKPATTTIAEIGLPTKKQAPYKIDTWSREYYALKAVKNKDGTVTMTDWWELLKNKWTLNKGTFILDKTYGEITVKKR